eukprot:CAMPEP_0176192570 /NCGR_PEP_ID=MMETSP0121_2-20121125/5040_1 /TAXON_ID=160619 /ORGANISM="Kryptoperidinium foliaceum, Strain CCMP 1326" /LENGTH=275 /DNA_ID=CAMNT_0017531263 /DNA_START=47 /DNA_END=874 /DNA_ORIENTATION=+
MKADGRWAAPRPSRSQGRANQAAEQRVLRVQRDVRDVHAQLVAATHSERLLRQPHELLEGVVRGEGEGQHSVDVGHRLRGLPWLDQLEDGLTPVQVATGTAVLRQVRVGSRGGAIGRRVASGGVPVPRHALVLAPQNRVAISVDALGYDAEDLSQAPRLGEVLARPRMYELLPLLHDVVNLLFCPSLKAGASVPLLAEAVDRVAGTVPPEPKRPEKGFSEHMRHGNINAGRATDPLCADAHAAPQGARTLCVKATVGEAGSVGWALEARTGHRLS